MNISTQFGGIAIFRFESDKERNVAIFWLALILFTLVFLFNYPIGIYFIDWQLHLGIRTVCWLTSPIIIFKLAKYWNWKVLRYIQYTLLVPWVVIAVLALIGTSFVNTNDGPYGETLKKEVTIGDCKYRTYLTNGGAISDWGILIKAEYDISDFMKLTKDRVSLYHADRARTWKNANNKLSVEITPFYPIENSSSRFYQTELSNCLLGSKVNVQTTYPKS